MISRNQPMINNTEDYIALLKDRALGTLPDMGCALRVANLIKGMPSRLFDRQTRVDILDVGCGAGHFYRTFIGQDLTFAKYVGLEIDPGMVEVANEVWAREVDTGVVEFVNQDLEQFSSSRQFDFVICVNAFMYFASAKTALTNLMRATRHHLLIRSYFSDSNYRIVRAQTTLNHDKAELDEIDIFDEDGNMLCYDFWNIYSFSYIEALVAKIDPRAKVAWLDDKNVLESLERERKLKVKKRGATEVLQGFEISYPFILPWKYLSISFDTAR